MHHSPFPLPASESWTECKLLSEKKGARSMPCCDVMPVKIGRLWSARAARSWYQNCKNCRKVLPSRASGSHWSHTQRRPYAGTSRASIHPGYGYLDLTDTKVIKLFCSCLFDYHWTSGLATQSVPLTRHHECFAWLCRVGCGRYSTEGRVHVCWGKNSIKGC